MEMDESKDKFCVIGIVTNPDYQKCKSLIERLKISFPKRYDTPSIIPMLDIDWNDYLIMVKRELGGRLWENRKPVIVFLNGKYLGDDVNLQNYLNSIYKFGIVRDFDVQGEQNLLEIMHKEIAKQRKYVYMTVSVDNRIIGTMLFLIYNDLVPETANLFLKRIKSRTQGYICTPIHRIVKNGWIQCGGYDIVPKTILCENYVIPHDKRGVLSMCNTGRHKQNSTQFHVSLIPNEWMNYRYVAFGQLIHGDNVLKILEKIPTYHQKPLKYIKIVDTGEYLQENQFIKRHIQDAEEYLEDDKRADKKDLRYVTSDMSVSRFRRGLYYHCNDLRSHPSMIPGYLQQLYQYGDDEEEERLEADGSKTTVDGKRKDAATVKFKFDQSGRLEIDGNKFEEFSEGSREMEDAEEEVEIDDGAVCVKNIISELMDFIEKGE